MNGQNIPKSNQPESVESTSPQMPNQENPPTTTQKATDELGEVKKEMSSFERATVRLAWLAFLVSVAAAIFIGLQWREMKSGGADTHELAVAAGNQAQAAVVQSQQTENLATTASIQARAALGQVDQLEAGVRETHALAEAARKQAVIADKALELAAGSDRPWIGFTTPSIGNIEANKPTDVTVQITNAGKSPARITEFISASNLLISFPKDPDYSAIQRQTISHTVLVPGSSAANKFKMGSMIQPVIDFFKKGTPFENGVVLNLYIYSRATYEDLRTHKVHHTWACFYWDAKTETLSNCPEYNDAD